VLETVMSEGHAFPEEHCPASLVDAGMLPQCRPFAYFTSKNLRICEPYLDPLKHYYLADFPLLDKAPFSVLRGLNDHLTQTLPAECVTNIQALLCNTWYRECKSLGNGEGVQEFYPSLMCRSECERHLEIHDNCLAELRQDDDAFAAFELAMENLVRNMENIAGRSLVIPALDVEHRGSGSSPFRLLQCDVTGGNKDDFPDEENVLSYILGRYPSDSNTRYGRLPVGFPANMNTTSLYPIETSRYTTSSGATHDVPCTVPTYDLQVVQLECPGEFLPPRSQDDRRNCIKPCPVQVYSDQEYDHMWLAHSVPASFGLLLNGFMATTWAISEPVFFEKQRFEVRVSVAAGLLYGIVDTLPVLFLRSDLPCSCDTEECAGTSSFCAFNRAAKYILLVVIISLAHLTKELYTTLANKTKMTNLRGTRYFFACSWPMLSLLNLVKTTVEGHFGDPY
jgi:hypothetical protein